jgi:endonuclease III
MAETAGALTVMAPATAISSGWRALAAVEVRGTRRRMQRLTAVLAARYGTPDLGNVADPLDEAIYILLTYQTDLARARQVLAALRVAYPSWQAVLDAPEDAVSEVLRPSGFHRARARLIRCLLAAVAHRWGALSLEPLRVMSDEDAEAELRALPGLDIKGARCVLMYSLGREVFPVDSNVYRFMQRYGVLAQSARYRRRSTHDDLQALIPPTAQYALHVNLVVHGQMTCLPQKPLCSTCPVRRTCPTGRGQSR